MLIKLVRLIPWLWHNLIIPYIINALLSLVSDGLEALSCMHETVYVLGLFLCGSTHRDYPVSRKQLKSESTAQVQTETNTISSGEEKEGVSERRDSGNREGSPLHTSSSTTNTAVDGVPSGPLIQRRRLMGKKGEVEEWYPEVQGKPLIAQRSSFKYLSSLHQLTWNVVGLHPPTISFFLTAHSPPVWPPHYSRRRLTQPRDGNNEGYSSNYSTNNSAPASPSRVVYNRTNANQVEFKNRKRGSPQLIADITTRHVLSYLATRQKVLVMDLDETLCHVATNTAGMQGPPTFSEVIPTPSGGELFHVWERPYVRLFLTTVSKLFNLVLFTSSSMPYADTILRHIDPDHLIKERYYRQHCRPISRNDLYQNLRKTKEKYTRSTKSSASDAPLEPPQGPHIPARKDQTPLGDDSEGSDGGGSGGSSNAGSDYTKPKFNGNVKILVKDLRILKVPPELLIMVDNSEECTLLNRENALIVPPYIPSIERMQKSDGEDEVLLSLISFLECLLIVPDVRSVLREGNLT